MNRATRDKIVSGTGTDLTTGNACWETAPRVFEKLNEDFGPFDLDLTADGERHLCPMWFGPDSVEPDALAAEWSAWGTDGFSNPPYGWFVQRMLQKAREQRARGVTSTLLLPMRVTVAFKAHVLGGAQELLFCDKRLCFFEHGVPRLNERRWTEDKVATADSALFDSIIVRYVPTRAPMLKVGIWQVPSHVSRADLDRAVARRGV